MRGRAEGGRLAGDAPVTRVATRRGAYRRGGRVANDPSRSATRGRRGVGREGARAYPRRSRRRGWDSSRGCSCTRTRRRSPRRGTPWRARCGCERGCSPRSSWREAASCRRSDGRGAVVLGQGRARAPGDSPAERRTGKGKRREDPPGRRARRVPQRPRSGSVVRKRTGDGAPRPRDPRAFGKRRRAPEEAERACFAAAFEAAARRASVGVAASATRPEERWRMGGVSRHACRSFVLADLRPRSRDFPNDGTGGLDRRRLGSRRERLSPNADRNDARRSIEPNEPPDSSSS